MESVKCILCGAASGTVLVQQRDINLGSSLEVFTVVRCDGCGLIFQNPRPTADEIRRYYPPEYYPLEESGVRRPIDRVFKRWSNSMKRAIREEFYAYPGQSGGSRSKARRALQRLILAPEYWHLRFARRDCIPFRGTGRILDVGCGPGRLLRSLRDQGWEAHGVDFSPVAVEHAKTKHGLEVKLGELAAAAYPDSFFDVVVFSHSLEHVYDPVDTLREAHRILKTAGLLLIYVPNAGSFESFVFGKWWVPWEVPRHLFHFTSETMTRLLDRTGFRLVKVRHGVGTSSFLGSVDTVYKHVLRTGMKHGSVMRHFIAMPVCMIAGHLGYGGELQVYAEKAMGDSHRVTSPP